MPVRTPSAETKAILESLAPFVSPKHLKVVRKDGEEIVEVAADVGLIASETPLRKLPLFLRAGRKVSFKEVLFLQGYENLTAPLSTLDVDTLEVVDCGFSAVRDVAAHTISLDGMDNLESLSGLKAKTLQLVGAPLIQVLNPQTVGEVEDVLVGVCPTMVHIQGFAHTEVAGVADMPNLRIEGAKGGAVIIEADDDRELLPHVKADHLIIHVTDGKDCAFNGNDCDAGQIQIAAAEKAGHISLRNIKTPLLVLERDGKDPQNQVMLLDRMSHVYADRTFVNNAVILEVCDDLSHVRFGDIEYLKENDDLTGTKPTHGGLVVSFADNLSLRDVNDSITFKLGEGSRNISIRDSNNDIVVGRAEDKKMMMFFQPPGKFAFDEHETRQ